MKPLWLSLEVASLATLAVIATGLPIAFGLLKLPRRLSRFVEAFMLWPLVIPPSATGLALLWLLGDDGPVGRICVALFGETLLFSRAAAVIAATVISFPLFVRSARAALEAVPRRYIDLARSLGDSPLGAALRVHLPLARRGLLSGVALSFGRAMGEFGATLMVAGLIQGRTETLALAVYNHAISSEDEQAWAAALLLAVVASLVLFAMAWWEASE